MRGVRFVGKGLALLTLVGVLGAFVAVLTSAGQTTAAIRLRVDQVIEQFVIDLADSSPEDTPRYNLIALADLDRDNLVDLVTVNTVDDELNLNFNNGSGLFEDPVTIEAVEPDDITFGPVAVVPGDFTGPFDQNDGAPDGNVDLALVDDFGSVTIMIGDGEGDFATPDQLLDDIDVIEVTGAVAADFDGNGDLDLAIAAGDQVVFVCNQDGTLQPCSETYVVVEDQNEPIIVDLAVGDFDNDGRSDVAALAMNRQLVYPIFSDGGGSFSLGIAIGLAEVGSDSLYSLAVTDFDNDGFDDIVAVSQDDSFGDNGIVALGSANRAFQSRSNLATAAAFALEAGNFSDDSDPDILFALESDRLAYETGDGTGNFSASLGAQQIFDRGVDNRFLSGAAVLKSADLNNDGLRDVVGLVRDGTQIEVALNVVRQPTQTAGPTTVVTGTPGQATPTPTGPTPTRTMPPPTATRTPVPTAGLGRCDYNISNVSAPGAARGVVVADLNGGAPDIAVSDGSRVHVIYNTGTEDLRACARAQRAGDPPTDPPSSVMSEALSGAGDLAVLDTDGDGDLEIAVARPGLVSFLQINGQGVPVPITALQATVPGNPVQIVTDYAANPIGAEMRRELDIDGDDTTDVLVANDGANSISILYGNPGGAAFTVVSQPINARSRSISAGDVNGDGRVDIVVGTDTGVLYLVQGAPSGGRPTFSTTGTATVPAPVVSLQTGFFNDDALADVFLADRTSAARILITTDTLSSPTRVLAFPLFVQASAASTLFFDPLDAALDVVVSLPDTAQLVFGLGDAAGGIARSLAPLATGPLPRDLASADVDLDTQTDVVTANGDGTISILISSEPPPTPTPTITMTPTPVTPATEAPIPTATPTATGTVPTATPVTPSRTPTVPKPGTFQLSDGCAIADSQSTDAPTALLLGLTVLWAARRRRHAVD